MPQQEAYLLTILPLLESNKALNSLSYLGPLRWLLHVCNVPRPPMLLRATPWTSALSDDVQAEQPYPVNRESKILPYDCPLNRHSRYILWDPIFSSDVHGVFSHGIHVRSILRHVLFFKHDLHDPTPLSSSQLFWVWGLMKAFWKTCGMHCCTFVMFVRLVKDSNTWFCSHLL